MRLKNEVPASKVQKPTCAYAHKSMIWQHKLEHDRNSMNWGRKHWPREEKDRKGTKLVVEVLLN